MCVGAADRRNAFPAGSLSILARACPLRELDITGCEGVTDTDLSVLASECATTLEVFSARCCSFTGLGVAHLGSCLRLSAVNVNACFNVTLTDVANVAKVGEGGGQRLSLRRDAARRVTGGGAAGTIRLQVALTTS